MFLVVKEHGIMPSDMSALHENIICSRSPQQRPEHDPDYEHPPARIKLHVQG